jgi:catechol 2,3-dioxygenase-like lactoylglutathione lyase family enzyme
MKGRQAMNRTAQWNAHVAIHVKDLAKSIEFYRRLFGIQPCKVRRGYAKFAVSNPPLNFTLNEVSTEHSVSRSLSHMGIQVFSTEEVLAVRDRWIKEGLTPWDEMGTTCCHAVQDKAWVRDPDGNEWEVFVVLADADEAEPGTVRATKTAEPPCCGPACCAPAEAVKA